MLQKTLICLVSSTIPWILLKLAHTCNNSVCVSYYASINIKIILKNLEMVFERNKRNLNLFQMRIIAVSKTRYTGYFW